MNIYNISYDIHFLILKYLDSISDWKNWVEIFPDVKTKFFWLKLTNHNNFSIQKLIDLKWVSALKNINICFSDSLLKINLKTITYKYVHLLIKQGANVNILHLNNTLLYYFITNCKENPFFLRIIELFLKNGADPNTEETFFKDTCLFHCKSYTLVKLLLRYNADPNKKNIFGNTVLYYLYDYDIIKLLLQHNADPNLQNNYGNTLLHNMPFENKKKIINLLLNYGIDLLKKNNENKTCLDTALLFNNHINYKFMKKFIK
jgi:ankyrin repeat protein